MNRRELAVATGFAGLVMGMIVAFAGCSYSSSDELVSNHCKVIGAQ